MDSGARINGRACARQAFIARANAGIEGEPVLLKDFLLDFAGKQ